jgi:chromosome segregation ATPase
VFNRKKPKRKKVEELHQLISKKEQNVPRITIERNNAKTEFNASVKGTNEVSNKIHEIENFIIQHVTEQSDLKLAAEIAQDMVVKISDQTSSKNRELTEAQNENVQLRFEGLTNLDDIEKLESGLEEFVKEITEKEDLINQYTYQIQQNNVKISKKQKEVDKLNRKFDSLKVLKIGKNMELLKGKLVKCKPKFTMQSK